MLTHRILLGCGVLVAASAAATAPPDIRTSNWEMPEQYRSVQRVTLETQRSILLRMIDSMPVAYLREAAAPDQRDFAQQVHHAVSSITTAFGGIVGIETPTLPDTIRALSTRDGLRQIVNSGFDWLDSVLTTQSTAERNRTVSLSGREIPVWQLFDEFNEHSMWTAGQIVANFRKHGMPPPQFRFF